MKYKYLLIFIFLLASLLRLVWLDQTPPHMSNDEISIAYDAYSISKTQRDEHNHFLPLSFQSHNTYKAPLAIYLTVPLTMILGNNEYSLRLPSAVLGSLTVLFLGLLVYELSKNQGLALVSSFVLAVAPWHIFSSRIAYEANIALFFVVSGMYCFFKGLHSKNNWTILLSFIAFALSLYGYHTEWVFTPIIIATLIAFNYKKFTSKKILVIGIVLFLLLVSPLGVDYLSKLNVSTRANTEGFYNEPMVKDFLQNPTVPQYQKIQTLFVVFIGNYLSYTNFGYLFANGLDIPPKPSSLQLGLFLMVFLPSFLIGIKYVKQYFGHQALFIYLWAIFAPVVPALTKGDPASLRNLVSVIPYSIIIAVGTLVIWEFAKTKLIRSLLIVVFLVPSLLFMFFIYYLHFPVESGENFQYGYKQIAQYINAHYTQYNKIIIDPKFGDLHQYDGLPHLYIPYFTNLDPAQFLRERKDLQTGFYVDKYEMRGINWNGEKLEPNTLYIVPTSNVPSQTVLEGLETLHEVRLPNGRPAFRLFAMKWIP